MDDRRGVALAVALLGTLLWIGALRAFFAAIYSRSLGALTIDASAAATLLLLAAVLLPLVRRLPMARPDLALAALLAVARLIAAPGWGLDAALPAALACGAFLLWVPLHLDRHGNASTCAAGFALAWALDAALGLAAGWDPLAGELGPLLLLALAPLFVGLTLGLPPGPEAARTSRPLPGRGRAVLAGAGLGAWIFLVFVALGSPAHVTRWNGSVPLAGALLPLGLATGAWLATRRYPARPVMLAGSVALLGAVLDHGFWHSGFAPGTAMLGLMALALALGPLLAAQGCGRTGGWVAMGSVLLLLPFLFVLSLTFAYVPFGDVFRGLERWLPLTAWVLLVAGWVVASPASPRRAASRWPGRAAVLVVAVVVAGALTPAAPVESPGPDSVLRVAAFNVHQGYDNRGAVHPELYARVLREIGADIVALQESDTARITSGNLDLVRYLARELGYHSVYGPPTREQSFGTALLSRLPIVDWRVDRLPSNSDNRFLTEVIVDAWGTEVAVYPVHFALPYGDRLNQTTFLLERLGADHPLRPIIVAGDLNSCPGGLCPGFDGPIDTVYTRVAALLQDAWLVNHTFDDPAGYTYPAGAPNQRIDYVLASRQWGVLWSGVWSTRAALAASDHLPTVADLRLTPS